ncbi:MAG: GtrA family protein [Gammaproteobacteria bacterium]|nr:GtrA family protein [Gammaproteobacteria bacterium]
MLSKFIGIGSIGFLIDASILTLLVNAGGMGVVKARAISFAFAVTATWYLNRKWTFTVSERASKGSEYARYLAVQTIGAAINLAVYLVVLHIYPVLAGIPVIPLAMGSAVALAFNFIASRYWVFKERLPE